MALPGVRTAPTPEQASRLARKGCLPSVHERATIFLLLVEVTGKINKGQETPEAKKVSWHRLVQALRELWPACYPTRVLSAVSISVPILLLDGKMVLQISFVLFCSLTHGSHRLIDTCMSTHTGMLPVFAVLGRGAAGVHWHQGGGAGDGS